ncbi:MAG: protoporphyrinogen oxidase [Planctomycetota bacterium]|jgi:oxygen-dependent protoporphyrinogen oxidase
MSDVVIIGGGLAGLACAQTLIRSGRSVVVIEAGPRPGGVVGTREVDGFHFEAGPNTVQAGSTAFRTLCGELGLGPELVPSDDRAKVRWLWHRGALRPLPASPREFLGSPLFSTRAKLRVASEPLRRWSPPPSETLEPTLAELLEERLGPEPTELLAGAFVRGIYAGRHTELGARSAFPRLWSLLSDHGSLIRGMIASGRASRRRRRSGERPLPGPDVRASQLLSFPGGLQRVVDALETAIGPDLRTGDAAVALARNNDGWDVRTSAGRTHSAANVVLALPAGAAASLLEPSLDAEQRDFLTSIPHSSVRLAHLGFPPGELELPSGFGYLVPPSETGPDAPGCLGTIFASNLFPDRAPSGGAAVSCFYALDAVEGLDAETFCDRAAADLARALGRRTAPRPSATWTVGWRHSIAQYRPGHDRRFEALERHLAANAPGLWLAGGWTRGVSVEHVVARGREIGERLAVASTTDPKPPVGAGCPG